tara:strand:- start:2237 stop:2755 length:519 start_codon:yes stop_codon:yes gene_type:complete
MIRNYYTDSYKSGIPVTPSDTLLLDGRTKATTPQGAWLQYNLYVGNSPATLPITTTSDNLIVTNSVNVGLASPNAQIKAGMRVTGGTLPAAGVLIASVTNASNYVLATASSIAADSTLTYSYDTEASIKVHTINNEVVTFVKPAQGFVLPVSVVMVYATDTGGGISDLIALS